MSAIVNLSKKSEKLDYEEFFIDKKYPQISPQFNKLSAFEDYKTKITLEAIDRIKHIIRLLSVRAIETFDQKNQGILLIHQEDLFFTSFQEKLKTTKNSQLTTKNLPKWFQSKKDYSSYKIFAFGTHNLALLYAKAFQEKTEKIIYPSSDEIIKMRKEVKKNPTKKAFYSIIKKKVCAFFLNSENNKALKKLNEIERKKNLIEKYSEKKLLENSVIISHQTIILTNFYAEEIFKNLPNALK